MNIAGIITDVLYPYPGVAYEIYVSGCTRKCEDCHNPEMWDFAYGNRLDLLKIVTDIDKRSKWIDIISILGGDLLCHNSEIAKFLPMVLKHFFPDKELWLFTGAEIEEVPDWAKEVFDVIKTGRYDAKLKQAGFPASSNQKLMKKGVDY